MVTSGQARGCSPSRIGKPCPAAAKYRPATAKCRPVAASGRPDGAHWARQVLLTRALTIGGGTTDIQLNIIAERILGLPRDPEPPAAAHRGS